jgi:hypothetical protein
MISYGKIIINISKLIGIFLIIYFKFDYRILLVFFITILAYYADGYADGYKDKKNEK